MLPSWDVELRSLAQIVKLAMAAAFRAHGASAELDIEFRSSLRADWQGQEPSLSKMANVLERWDEAELAKDVRQVITHGRHLIDDVPADGAALRKYYDAATQLGQEVTDLRLGLTALDPLLAPSRKSIDGRKGVAVALVLRTPGERRSELRRFVSAQLRGAPAVLLSHNDFAYPSSVESELPGKRRLPHVSSDDGQRLVDEHDQDLFSPEHLHRYDIHYFLLLGEKPRLDLLMRLAWGLASLAPRDSPSPQPTCFWICAAPAQAAYGGSLQLRENDAVFDNLSRIVSEDKLANCLLVHPTLVSNPKLGLGRWFAPAWRVPFQHRQKVSSDLECLWSTMSFGGLPGEDLLGAVARDGSAPEPVCWTPDHAKEEAEPARSPVRAAARLLLRHPVPCALWLGRDALPAYLVDYSALGCRLLLPMRGVEWGRIMRSAVKLHLPAGLPWPWEPSWSICERVAPARVVRHSVYKRSWRNEHAQPIVVPDDLEVTLRFTWGARSQAKPASIGSSSGAATNRRPSRATRTSRPT